VMMIAVRHGSVSIFELNIFVRVLVTFSKEVRVWLPMKLLFSDDVAPMWLLVKLLFSDDVAPMAKMDAL
jgi:hypothetical protein